MDLGDGRKQPFYRSTGRCSNQPGTWFPCYGFLEDWTHPVGWGVKPCFYKETADRFGDSPEFREISQSLADLFKTGCFPRWFQASWVYAFNRWIGSKEALKFNDFIREFLARCEWAKDVRKRLKAIYIKGRRK